MENENKLGQLGVLAARVEKNLKDIADFDMAGLAPWWPTLQEKSLAINEDLRILLPLAAEVHPSMVVPVNKMKAAVVKMRIDSYNRMNDVTAGGHQEPEVCEAMKAHGIELCSSKRAEVFCLEECPYQARCLSPTEGTIS